MMAARAHASLQRVRPKVYSIAHRCTLPTVGRFGMGTAGNNKSREKQQQIEKVACDSSDGRARAFRALQRQTRDIHVTPRNENTLILSGLGVAASAMAARYGLQAYNNWKVKHGEQPEPEATKEQPVTDEKTAGEKSAQGESTTSSLFGAFGKRHYEGGFDDKMSRREAALILGVRESAAPQRIKDAHRRILMINHPDKGGSKYMAAKINEAKEMLLKGRV